MLVVTFFGLHFKFDLFLGVADGVGGWRNHGVDPGEFSFSLMRACEKLVENELFSPSKPEILLASGFSRIREANSVQGMFDF